jgi:hypothetical protein
MALSLRMCASPSKPDQTNHILPKRMARARRVMESKRMDSFKEIHEALKKTANEEIDFVKGLFDKKSRDDDVEEEDEKDSQE